MFSTKSVILKDLCLYLYWHLIVTQYQNACNHYIKHYCQLNIRKHFKGICILKIWLYMCTVIRGSSIPKRLQPLSRCVISIVQCNSGAFTSLRWRSLKCQFYKFPVAYTCNLQWTTKNRILIKILKSLKVPAWLNWSCEHKTSPLANHVIG